ncbi:MAG: transcription antitermination factor NusB [Alphaproteobacteria bacterium]|nr:transcription antitermination factor NusB [Alphaproteobacteria bacterium]
MSVAAASSDPNSRPGRRRLARLGAVQALYQIEISATPVELVIAEFLAHRLGQELDGDRYGEADGDFFSLIVRGVSGQRQDLDDMIAAALTTAWTVARLDAILRHILRAGAFELAQRPDVPARAVINEYLDLAKAFFDGTEPRLVNGVLDRLGHVLRPEELGPAAQEMAAERG